MPETITIRYIQPGDALSIFRFVCELENESFDFTVFNTIFIRNISHNNFIYLAATNDEGIIVGYISCHGQLLLHHLGMVYEIQELFVDKLYRQKGIGKLLLQSLENELKGSAYLSLEVTPNIVRKDAALFYPKCGFTQTHIKFTKKLSL